MLKCYLLLISLAFLVCSCSNDKEAVIKYNAQASKVLATNKDVIKLASATIGDGHLTPELREISELMTAFASGFRDKDMYLRLSLVLGGQQATYIQPFGRGIDKLKQEMANLREMQKQIKDKDIIANINSLNSSISNFISTNDKLYSLQSEKINNMMMYFLDLTKGKPIIENDIWQLGDNLNKYINGTVDNIKEMPSEVNQIQEMTQSLKNTLKSKKYPSEF